MGFTFTQADLVNKIFVMKPCMRILNPSIFVIIVLVQLLFAGIYDDSSCFILERIKIDKKWDIITLYWAWNNSNRGERKNVMTEREEQFKRVDYNPNMHIGSFSIFFWQRITMSKCNKDNWVQSGPFKITINFFLLGLRPHSFLDAM